MKLNIINGFITLVKINNLNKKNMKLKFIQILKQVLHEFP